MSAGNAAELSSNEAFLGLRQMIMAFRTTVLVHAAAELNLPDLIAQGIDNSANLAHQLQTTEAIMSRLLRTLVSVGLFETTTDGRMRLNAKSDLLRKAVPGSLRNTALFYGNQRILGSYALLSEIVRAGRSAFDLQFGRSFYEYLGEDAVLGPIFHGMMTDFTEQECAAVVDAYDFSKVRRVVDVGGGHGGLVTALLKKHQSLAGLVFDQARPTEDTLADIRKADLEHRLKFEAGDFFRGVPDGGDIYVLKSIIHNWHDNDAIRILASISAAMLSGSRLLVVERIIPEGNAASEAKLFDINMMVTAGGLERIKAEHERLLNAAGLFLIKIFQRGHT